MSTQVVPAHGRHAVMGASEPRPPSSSRLITPVAIGLAVIFLVVFPPATIVIAGIKLTDARRDPTPNRRRATTLWIVALVAGVLALVVQLALNHGLL